MAFRHHLRRRQLPRLRQLQWHRVFCGSLTWPLAPYDCISDCAKPDRVLEAAECGEEPKFSQDEIEQVLESGALGGMVAFQEADRANLGSLQTFTKLKMNVRAAGKR